MWPLFGFKALTPIHHLHHLRRRWPNESQTKSANGPKKKPHSSNGKITYFKVFRLFFFSWFYWPNKVFSLGTSLLSDWLRMAPHRPAIGRCSGSRAFGTEMSLRTLMLHSWRPKSAALLTRQGGQLAGERLITTTTGDLTFWMRGASAENALLRCHANGIVFWQATERLWAPGQNLPVAAAATLPQLIKLVEDGQRLCGFFFLPLLSEHHWVLLSQRLCSCFVQRPFRENFRLASALMATGSNSSHI